MKGILLCVLTIAGCVLAGVTAHASATVPAISPAGVHVFEAYLQDSPCGNNVLCGTGKLTGFGRVKTRAAFRPSGAAPAGCLAVAGLRTLTLKGEPKSSLRLAVKGALCGSRASGTFTISSGRGVFDRSTGKGIIRGSVTATRHEHLHYAGVLTLHP